jgi:N-acyl-D-aspartate/D-glutamate deacylase
LLDLLFRNALIFDGTGNAPSISDIAIADGRIAAMGQTLDASARKVIAADGLALMPGIIDSHTHFDAQITWDPWVRPSPALGGDDYGDW